jgi:hypothetical protein
MKQHYQADLLRTLANEDNNIIGLWGKKYSVGCYIYGVSQAWSCVNPVTLVQSWKKRLPDLKEDLQGFPNEKVNKSEIFDMCAMRNFQSIDKDDVQ